MSRRPGAPAGHRLVHQDHVRQAAGRQRSGGGEAQNQQDYFADEEANHSGKDQSGNESRRVTSGSVHCKNGRKADGGAAAVSIFSLACSWSYKGRCVSSFRKARERLDDKGKIAPHRAHLGSGQFRHAKNPSACRCHIAVGAERFCCPDILLWPSFTVRPAEYATRLSSASCHQQARTCTSTLRLHQVAPPVFGGSASA